MAANKEDEPEHIQRIIERLGLVPHPEGGYFVETLRAGCAPMQSRGYTDLSGEVIQTDVGPRNSCTGEPSRLQVHFCCQKASLSVRGSTVTTCQTLYTGLGTVTSVQSSMHLSAHWCGIGLLKRLHSSMQAARLSVR